MAAEENLDALCSLLDDSFDDIVDGLVDDELSKIENENIVSSQPPASQDNNEVSEMEEKLRKMQEEMLRVQEQLAKAKNSQQPNVAKPRVIKETDVLKASTSRSAVYDTLDAPILPVKTNPFADADKPRKSTQYHPETPDFGPSLSKKTTRVLSKEEALKLNLELKKRENDRDMAAIAAGDLAFSSDEESERDPTVERYNSFGKEIKRISRAASLTSSLQASNSSSTQKSFLGFNEVQGSQINLSNQSANKALPKNMIVEKHSKLRISNPVITQMSLDLSLMGRKMIPLHRIKTAIMMKETDSDWTTIGVVCSKFTQKSKNGNTYTMWKISDLTGDLDTVTVLLFGRANTKHYSMPVNKVVGLLNAKIMEDRSGKGEVSLSVDHPDKIMEMGDSIDCGKCKAKKADGGNCTNLVNLNSCEYCVYHVKKAYKAMSSGRSALQSSFSGGDSRSRIMAKIAPKGEVFARGQILNQQSGLPGKKLGKNVKKDQALLASLGVTVSNPVTSNPKPKSNIAQKLNDDAFFNNDKSKLAFRSHLTESQKTAVRKVANGVSEELGLKLLNPTPGSRLLMKHLTRDSKEELEKNKTRDELEAMKKARVRENQTGAKKLLMETKKEQIVSSASTSVPSPKLGRGMSSNFIDLDFGGSSSNKTTNLNRSKAAAILALKGKTLTKSDPNYVMKRKRSLDDVEESQRKVAKTLLNESTENITSDESKTHEEKPKKVVRSFTGEIIDEKRLEELKNRKSINQNLVNVAELEEEEAYFNKAEKKEAMEEKMINTKEIEAKVVTCQICNYTSYKQSELCKSSNHFVKVVKTKKRFFECKSCKNRTHTFDKIPKHACSKCSKISWVRCGMMREKKGPLLDNEKLLIRGQEEKFIGSAIKKSDLVL